MKIMYKLMLSVLVLSTYALNSATADEEALIAAVRAFANASDADQWVALGKKAVEVAERTKARPDVVGKDGESALHWLAWGKTFLVRARYPNRDLWILFSKIPNLNVNVKNFLGQTPLYLAAENKSDIMPNSEISADSILELLLKAGANPNIASNTNTTPLSIAAENGFLKGIKLLLEKGAQTRVANQWGNDAIKNAERSTKNKGTKWQAVAIIKDWQDTHPGQ